MTAARTRTGRPVVLVVGGGAAGTLTAVHLARAAGRRGTALDVVVLEASEVLGRGPSFGAADEEHLLNVPVSGMSALPEDPGHFGRWVQRQDPDLPADTWRFVPRRQFGRYLADTLAEALAGTEAHVGLRHLHERATGLERLGERLLVRTGTGRELGVDAVVLATGLPAPGAGWAPEAVRTSAFFVVDPWAPGALDVVRRDRAAPAAVLVVGTGLTMVDLALALARADRPVIAVSRGGRLPRPHASGPKLAAIPDVTGWGSTLPQLRAHVARHLSEVTRAGGDWRPAMDGLRFRVQELWARLPERDRVEFLDHDAAAWNALRHRMPRAAAEALHRLRGDGRLHLHRGTVVDAVPLPCGGLRVELDDGARLDVGWVLNATGPERDDRRRADPLLDDLVRDRDGGPLATAATAGLGLRTAAGRLLTPDGSAAAPLWTLGAPRRGELWETTAVPELRTQALAVATAVLDAVAPTPRRPAEGTLAGGRHAGARPRDPLGLPLSTTAEAAAAFNAGLERVMRLQAGAEDLLRDAVVLDPGFALGHAALAMLGHEAGARADVAASLDAARWAVQRRGDDRERSLVDVIARRIGGERDGGARDGGERALAVHVAEHPRDVLAVSAAVPTIAFSGVVDLRHEAWELVERLAPAYGDHWWYISLLAFTRQDQGRYEEAGLLAESALACEPASGHAVHAQTHVMYETGLHEEGRVWLDHWVTGTGRSAGYLAHFAWHAALHDLALGDVRAAGLRYAAALSPSSVTGVRALVDSASLLWRWRVAHAAWDPSVPPPPAAAPLRAVIDPDLLSAPRTPFIGLHAALALSADGDVAGLKLLREHAERSSEPALRGTVADVCDALGAVVEERWSQAWTVLDRVRPDLPALGGTAAQREVLEETLLLALARDGRVERARDLLVRRLAARESPADRRRLAVLSAAGG